jgi:predicted protein tyrosine phosphatase
MKLLFICTANIDRSPTGEDIYKNKPGFEAKSAGTEEGYAEVLITKELIVWADTIFCMEQNHRKRVLELDLDAWNKTVVMNIPDDFYRGHPDLVQSIQVRVQNFLSEVFLNKNAEAFEKMSQKERVAAHRKNDTNPDLNGEDIKKYIISLNPPPPTRRKREKGIPLQEVECGNCVNFDAGMQKQSWTLGGGCVIYETQQFPSSYRAITCRSFVPIREKKGSKRLNPEDG